MPYLMIRTNCRLDDKSAVLTKASQRVASALGKPERYVMVSIEDNVDMCFAGDTTPCAYLELKSIGLPGDRTAALSATLCELMASELTIASDRVYIEFADAERHMWGFNGKTFA